MSLQVCTQFAPRFASRHARPAREPLQTPATFGKPHASPAWHAAICCCMPCPHSSFCTFEALESAGGQAFKGVETAAQENAHLKRNLPVLDVRTTDLGGDHRAVSVNVCDAIIRHLQESPAVFERTLEKSEEWKKGDKWKQLETDTIDAIDKGSVARNHPHLMRPAGPDEADDVRVGVLMYGDEVETVDTGYAKSKHKLMGVQVAVVNLPAEQRFYHDNLLLCAVARHPAVMAKGMAGIFAGVDSSGKRIANGATLSDDFIEGAAGRWFKVLRADGTEKWYRLKLHLLAVCGDYPQVRCATPHDDRVGGCVTRSDTHCVTLVAELGASPAVSPLRVSLCSR